MPPREDHEQAREPRLERLALPGESASVPDSVQSLGLWELPEGRGGRPRVLLNMVSTLDGRASVSGRSGAISGEADRALFHALRASVDGVLVGAGTVRKERYGRMIREQSTREMRRSRGLQEEPLACIVSGRLALDGEIPLLHEPAARVAILTASEASLDESELRAHVDYVRCDRDGAIDLSRCLVELRERLGVQSLLCEGGPHLARDLFAGGLVDELFLSLSPLLAGGDASSGGALRILAGRELDPPVELELRDVLRSSSSLFLRYEVPSGARVARETMLSSSLAS